MSAVWKFALSYPREIGLAVAVGLSVMFALNWVQSERDEAAAMALYDERTEDLRDLVAQRDSMARQVQVRDSLARKDSIRIAHLRTEAESARAEAEQAVQAASARAIQSGRNLTSTLDSIAVVLPDLGQVAREQWRGVQRAEREEDEFQQDQLEAEQAKTEAAEQESVMWRGRFFDERELRVATERALDEARSALEAGAQIQEGSWTDHWLIKTAALAGAGYVGYQVGVR